jgi:hypothetical protein
MSEEWASIEEYGCRLVGVLTQIGDFDPGRQSQAQPHRPSPLLLPDPLIHRPPCRKLQDQQSKLSLALPKGTTYTTYASPEPKKQTQKTGNTEYVYVNHPTRTSTNEEKQSYHSEAKTPNNPFFLCTPQKSP